MQKELLVGLVKSELFELISHLSEENLGEVAAAIQGQVNILKAIDDAVTFSSNDNDKPDSETNDLSEVKESNKNTNTTDFSEDEQQTSDDLESSPTEQILDNGKTVKGFFTQSIIGGTMHQKKKIFVPEIICRNNDLVTGDFLEARQVGWTKKNNPEYEFELIRKSEKVYPKVRDIHEFLPVKNNLELKRLYVEINDSDSGIVHPILLSDYDVRRYYLNEGDLITYAHKISDVMDGRVVWKHPIQSMDVVTRKKPHARREESKKTPEGKKQPIFQDLKIMMIGGRARAISKAIETEITSRKGAFVYMDGDGPHKSLESNISKADIVVIYTQSISHDAASRAKDICKQNNVVHTFTKNLGATGFVRRVSLLKKQLHDTSQKVNKLE